MQLFSTYPILLSFALLGCGGAQPQQGSSLVGTWYFQTTDIPPALVGRHAITQQGNDVLITYCNRQTYALKLQDGVLVDPLGLPYYLQPSGSDRLVGQGDAGNRSQAVKVSNEVSFDSGSLSVFASGWDDLVTSQGVCAEERAGRFVALDGTEISPRVVTITAQYGNSFLRIQAAFHSLLPGVYSVLDIDSFVHAPTGAASLDIQSPAYGNTFGDSGAVPITSGTMSIKSSDPGNFQLEGLLTTTLGATISFSSTVVLGK
jgi:hypothetical protein